MSEGHDLDGIYDRRFGEDDHASKDQLWLEVCRWLQRWIRPQDRVLDLACDRGYFIRNVEARERWAVDVRDMAHALGPGIHFARVDASALSSAVPARFFDVVFTSNFLEHLPSPDAVVATLVEAHAVLRPGGRLIVLQPNIRFVGSAYWDFIDHRVPLTERSLTEAARAAGFEIERVIPRFLPYTTKSRLPKARVLVRLYLRTPIAWRLLGKQTLLVARKPAPPGAAHTQASQARRPTAAA